MKNYLGVDWGEKRIGLALANSESQIATPFRTVNNVSELITIIEQEKIKELVIGLPRKMIDGQVDNPKFINFLLILEDKMIAHKINNKIKINFIDERLSSVQADSLKNKKIKQDRDCVSAMIILQAYLDKIYD
ncbi:MAG: Holliday junction resolvase RuvX [Patescibacteria group bacterium]|nr:Holliday junction resolvase RuvX [Patescibacteria group bacterium]